MPSLHHAASAVVVLFMLAVFPAAAHDVRLYEIIKGSFGTQIADSAPPARTWYYYAQLHESTPGAYTSVVLTRPAPLSPIALTRINPSLWQATQGFGPNKFALDATIPSGTYLFTVYNGTTAMGAGSMVVTDDRYPSNPPLFTGDTYSRLQFMSSCELFSVALNGFIPHAGAEGGYVQADITDDGSGTLRFGRFYPAETGGFLIPVQALIPDQACTSHVSYIDYTNQSEAGFPGVRPVLGFHSLTYAQFRTADEVCPCQADLIPDGIVDFGDYLEFLNLYNAGDSRADFTADGFVDFTDYLEFLNHFDAGC